MENFKKVQIKFSSNSNKNYFHYFYEKEQCLYVINQKRDSLYLKCISKNCHCRAKITDNIMTRTNDEDHNHDNHKHVAEFETAYELIKQEVSNSSMPVRHIHRVAIRKLSREAAGIFCWGNIRNTLQRIRRMKLPACKSYDELNVLMENNSKVIDIYTKLRGEDFFYGMLNDNMFFANPHLITALKQGYQFFIDCTFKVTPFQTQQLLVILATFEEKSLPIIYVIMKNKTENAYKDVFEFIKDVVLKCNKCFVAPAEVVMDFELAMRNAFKCVWPETVMRGCNFHFTQSLLRKAKKIPLLSNKMNEKHHHFHILKQFMRLSLLPLNLVKNGLNLLLNEIGKNKALDHDFAIFKDYFNEVWCKRYSFTDWNVSNCRHRTNNVIEGYNHKIKQWIPLNPSVWDFMEALLDLAIDADSNYVNLRQKQKLGIKTDLSKITPTLNDLLPKLKAGEISELVFVVEMAKIGKITNLE